MTTRAFLLSALITGAIVALLGNIPILNFVNCFLCAWVWGGGILAVFLYQRFEQANPLLSVGQGAGLGAVAGVVGALIGGVVSAIFNAIFGALNITSALSSALSQSSPEVAQYLPMLIGGGGFELVTLCINLFLYAAFGAIGGVIATALIWKKPTTV
jgi:hypothetical protein